MGRIDILEELGKKETEAADIADKVAENPDLLPELLDGISSASSLVFLNCFTDILVALNLHTFPFFQLNITSLEQ